MGVGKARAEWREETNESEKESKREREEESFGGADRGIGQLARKCPFRLRTRAKTGKLSPFCVRSGERVWGGGGKEKWAGRDTGESVAAMHSRDWHEGASREKKRELG